ncbi:MAG: hypothetical protein JWL64_245, partial [Frankiales bacterium]|nr:hypothetical protein [Frankiales bacterium]
VAGWAWAPTVLTQVFLAVTAVGALQSGAWLLALPLGVLLLAVLYQLALPEARASYRR